MPAVALSRSLSIIIWLTKAFILLLPSWKCLLRLKQKQKKKVHKARHVTGDRWQVTGRAPQFCFVVRICIFQPINSLDEGESWSQTDYVCHRQFVSVSDCLCPSQAVCVCHRQSDEPSRFCSWGDLLKSIPCISVWHEKRNFFVNKFIPNFVLHTSNYLVWDDKKYIGQAPRPFMTPD